MSLLYFDNPVGTGFSFTENVQGYATNQKDVARDLYNALQQFFTLFSNYRNSDFYITGESYAGKYIPALGSLLHDKHNESKINFKGVAIGNGYIDPETMMGYSSFLYKIGLFDEAEAKIGKFYEMAMLDDIHHKRYVDCIDKRYEYLGSKVQSFFRNVTGLNYFYNLLLSEQPKEHSFFQSYVTQDESRKALHIGQKAFNTEDKVEDYLKSDICQSVKSWLVTLMENYKTLLYSGQLDIRVATSLTDNMINSLKWKGSDIYSQTKRKIWKVDGKVAGYLKKFKSFYYMVIRDAGHIVPYDQPKVALELITQFINGHL